MNCGWFVWARLTGAGEYASRRDWTAHAWGFMQTGAFADAHREQGQTPALTSRGVSMGGPGVAHATPLLGYPLQMSLEYLDTPLLSRNQLLNIFEIF